MVLRLNQVVQIISLLENYRERKKKGWGGLQKDLLKGLNEATFSVQANIQENTIPWKWALALNPPEFKCLISHELLKP